MSIWSRVISRGHPEPAFASIEGHTSYEECGWLLDAAARVREGCILEIGSFRGRSTAALAEGALRNPVRPAVFAIEPHDDFQGILGGRFGPNDRVSFFRNLDRAGLLAHVHLVNLPAEQVAPGFGQSIGLLWIDGNHAFESVCRDFDLWRRHLLTGASVAFHDTLLPDLGPSILVSQLLQRGEWILQAKVGQITALRSSPTGT